MQDPPHGSIRSPIHIAFTLSRLRMEAALSLYQKASAYIVPGVHPRDILALENLYCSSPSSGHQQFFVD